MCHDNSNDKKSGHQSSDKTVNGVGFAILGVAVILVLSSGFIFYQTCILQSTHKENDKEWLKLRESIYGEAVSIDSIWATKVEIPVKNASKSQKGKNTIENDSIKTQYVLSIDAIDKIYDAQKTLIARQDKLADDLRQETNNLINKMNGWLGFWMGVLAILGVFVPIALQIKLYRETRNYGEKLYDNFMIESAGIKEWIKDADNIIDRIKRQNKAEMKADCMALEIDIRKKFKETQLQIGDEMAHLDKMKFALIYRSFQSISDCPEISINGYRNTLLKNNWDELLKQLKIIISHNFSQQTNKSDKYHLSVILIQTASILNTIRRMTPHRSRPFKVLTEQSYQLVKELNDITGNNDQIAIKIQSFYNNLVNLHPF